VRLTIFLVPFAVVATAVLIRLLSWPLRLARVDLAASDWLLLLSRFSDPIPSILGMFVQSIGRLLIFVMFAALVIRRLYLFAKARSLQVPVEYSGIPFLLLFISAASIVVGFAAFVVLAVTEARQDIIAVRILNSAMLLAPLAVTWGELKSFGSHAKAVP
jgi:hypothetical protein